MHVEPLDFSKVFSCVSHSIVLERLAAHGLDRGSLCWPQNCLGGRAQSVGVNSATGAVPREQSWHSPVQYLYQ